MNIDLPVILDRFVHDVEAWLDSPSETSAKIAEMKQQIAALKSELAAEPLNAAIKALEDSDKQIRRHRQKQAADAIAVALKPLGVMLEPKSATKRKRLRSPKPATASDTEAVQNAPTAPTAMTSPQQMATD